MPNRLFSRDIIARINDGALLLDIRRGPQAGLIRLELSRLAAVQLIVRDNNLGTLTAKGEFAMIAPFDNSDDAQHALRCASKALMCRTQGWGWARLPLQLAQAFAYVLGALLAIGFVFSLEGKNAAPAMNPAGFAQMPGMSGLGGGLGGGMGGGMPQLGVPNLSEFNAPQSTPAPTGTATPAAPGQPQAADNVLQVPQ